MLKKRLIASLLWREGQLIQSKQFRHTNVVGNTYTAIDFFNTWAIDEIALLDVSRTVDFREKFHEDIRYVSRRCFVPLAVGGWISTLDEIRQFLTEGADKVIINTHAFEEPTFITEAAERFGKQCIVVSIDTKQRADGTHTVHIDRGRRDTGIDPAAWAEQAQKLGAGEILLRSIDKDGRKSGYDVDTLSAVSSRVHIPVIATGGAGDGIDFAAGLAAGASAVAGGNVFQHSEQSTKKVKNYLFEQGYPVRVPEFYDALLPRDPIYKVSV